MGDAQARVLRNLPQLSRRHLHRYVNEFSGLHNIRHWDTLEQMSSLTFLMDDKPLRYKDLIA